VQLLSAADYGAEGSRFNPRPVMFCEKIFSAELTLCDNSHSCLNMLGGEKCDLDGGLALCE